MRHTILFAALIAPALLAACGTAAMSAAHAVPAAIAVPPGARQIAALRASGAQVYACSTTAGGSYAWQLKAPDAILSDESGKAVGKHYAGPTWELADGSSVKAKVAAQAPAPTSPAVAWLLLAATSTAGSGLLTPTRLVQRIDTAGGVAPAGGCSVATAGGEVRVPYSARYVFYK